MGNMEFKRANIKVNGIVQGVGFRPFIHKLVLEWGLAGWIRNTTLGAEIEVEGKVDAIENFAGDMKSKAPILAAIEKVQITYFDDLRMYSGFKIAESDTEGKRKALVSPDVSICPDCLRELNDKNDRRYRYPFINCTNCGPRFTIIRDIPYDRKNTTMSEFQMCPECTSEYSNIENRRYHAQPDCCPKCGPDLEFLDDLGNPVAKKAPRVQKVEVLDAAIVVVESVGGGPIDQAIEALTQGKVVAIKGLGGFHLAARCDDEELAGLLRMRKQRDEKPFAIMVRDVETARRFAQVGDDEAKALESFRRPIVLLRKYDRNDFRYISENGYIGVMLPYTPLHYLLLNGELDSMIMTSANLSDMPIIYKNNEAITKLHGIADCFLMHNREIETRCDDSLQWVINGKEYHVRRSRGYVPAPIIMPGADGILACGAEQKASFAMANDSYVFLSQHIGDLKNVETFENYEQQISHFEKLFDVKAGKIVCDLHPDFMSTEYAAARAQKEDLKLVRVQHHHAHMASCMADNRIDERCLGIIWDGTGLGTDGTIWGSEFLVGDFSGYKRCASFKSMKLPGGDLAAKEIWRVGEALLKETGIDSAERFKGDMADRVRQMIGSDINCPLSSGIGRLFDGVAAIMGLKEVVSYEGQGAVLLEAEAEDCDESYPFEIVKVPGTEKNEMMEEAGEISCSERLTVDWNGMIRAIWQDVSAGTENAKIAGKFMNTLVEAAVCVCSKLRLTEAVNKVVLSGGTFQNMYILEKLTAALEKRSFEVYRHTKVSCNDEGLSFGQCAVCARRYPG